MARRDGTGPMGAGTMTGRGLGYCIGENEIRYGAGLRMGSGFGRPACRRDFVSGFRDGYGRGFRREHYLYQDFSRESKDLLQDEKELLQSRLEIIDEQLKNL